MELGIHRHFQAFAPLPMGVLILSSTFARADTASDGDQVKLARNHFKYDSITSEQERGAFDKFFSKSQSFDRPWPFGSESNEQQ
jgi:hypothetical protein